MSKVKLIAVIMSICASTKLFGYGTETDMYIGSQTFNIWEDFDNEFCNSLTASTPNGALTRKFYYIGLTLPDMFDPQAQDGIKSLLTELYENRAYFYIIVAGGPTGALYIKDDTYNQVQANITFNGPPPNENLPKLHAMAVYAQSRNDWGPFEKALIYGAYMHVIQDLYAHMIVMPSRFGHGYAIESDSAYSEHILYYPELYHEFFSGTFISTGLTGFIKDVYKGLSYVGTWVTGTAPCEFLYTYNIAGQRQDGWQDYDYIGPVKKFVEAANAPGIEYGTSSLTFERLKAYMHGWGIALFAA